MNANKIILLLALASTAAWAQSSNVITLVPSVDATTGLPTGAGELRFRDLEAAGAEHYVGFKAPGAVSANAVWILPAADVAGCLVSDGALNLSFSACGGGITFITMDPTAPCSGDAVEYNTSNNVLWGCVGTSWEAQLNANGAQTVTGVKTFAADILPSGTVNIGAPGNAFNFAEITDVIVQTVNLFGGPSCPLACSEYFWGVDSVTGSLYLQATTIPTKVLRIDGLGPITTYTNFIPSLTDSLTLGCATCGPGSAVVEFSDIYVENLHCSGTGCAPSDMMTTDTNQTVTGVKTWAASQLFGADNTYDEGDTTNALRRLYSHGVSTEDVLIAATGSSFATHWDIKASASSTEFLDTAGNTWFEVTAFSAHNYEVVFFGSLVPLDVTGSNGDLGYSITPWRSLYLSTDATIGSLASGATQCVEATTAGLLRGTGSPCGSGGGGSGTVTMISTTSPITGGTITTMGTIGCADCETLSTNQTVTGVKTWSSSQLFGVDNTYDIGTTTAAARNIYSRIGSTEDVLIGAGGTNFGTHWDIKASSSSTEFLDTAGNTWFEVTAFSAHNYEVVFFGSLVPLDVTGSNGDLGYSVTPWRSLYLSTNATIGGLAGSGTRCVNASGTGLLGVAAANCGIGTVTSIATSGPITGGTITSTGLIGCSTCITTAGGQTISNNLTTGDFISNASTFATAFSAATGFAVIGGGSVRATDYGIGTFGNVINSSAQFVGSGGVNVGSATITGGAHVATIYDISGGFFGQDRTGGTMTFTGPGGNCTLFFKGGILYSFSGAGC
jgi:hypothetical protein